MRATANAHPQRYDLSAQHDQYIKVRVYEMLWIVPLWEYSCSVYQMWHMCGMLGIAPTTWLK
jgi:hypothetical protein